MDKTVANQISDYQAEIDITVRKLVDITWTLDHTLEDAVRHARMLHSILRRLASGELTLDNPGVSLALELVENRRWFVPPG